MVNHPNVLGAGSDLLHDSVCQFWLAKQIALAFMYASFSKCYWPSLWLFMNCHLTHNGRADNLFSLPTGSTGFAAF